MVGRCFLDPILNVDHDSGPPEGTRARPDAVLAPRRNVTNLSGQGEYLPPVFTGVIAPAAAAALARATRRANTLTA